MNVLLCGAGLAGLAFINAMRNDATCTIDVIDRRQQFHSEGAGIVLLPNGVAALQRLGFEAELGRIGNALSHFSISRSGKAIEIDLRRVWLDCSIPTIGISRRQLHGMLASASAARASISFGKTLVALREDVGHVDAAFDDGSTKRYDLVVGADGVFSRVRTLTSTISPKRAGLSYYRFISEGCEQHRTSPHWMVYEADKLSFGHYGLGDAVHVYLLIPESLESQDEREAMLAKASSTFPLFASLLLTARDAPHFSHVYTLTEPVWGSSRCVLIGDASHAMSPTLSQGGSLAFADALSLAESVQTSGSVEQAVEAFIACRRGPTSWAMRMAGAQLTSALKTRVAAHVTAAQATAYMSSTYAPLVRQLLAGTNMESGEALHA